MSVMTRPSSPEVAASAPLGAALRRTLERLGVLMGADLEWVGGHEHAGRGHRKAEVRVGGRLAGTLRGDASHGAAAQLEAAAALLSEVLALESEANGLADEVLRVWEQASFAQRVADALAPATDVQRLCEVALDEAVRLLGARSAALRLRDEAGNESLCVSTRAAAAAEGAGAEDGLELAVLGPHPTGEPEELGTLRFTGSMRAGHFTLADAALARALSVQIGLLLRFGRVLEGARRTARARRESEMAREVQSSLLPREDPLSPGIEAAAACVPAPDGGGDHYGYLADPFGVLVAEVSGSGIGAAVAMAGARALLRAEAARAPSPAAALGATNHLLARDLQPAGAHATAFLARYNPAQRRLSYASAGHPPALLWRGADGRFERLEASGLALGIFENATYEQGEAILDPGDLVVLFTDGIIETRSPEGETFAPERICQTVMRHRRERPRTILYRLLEAVEAFRAGQPQTDDLTVVVLRAGREGQ